MPKAKKPARYSDKVELMERLTQVGIALSLEQDRDRLLEMILLEAKAIANADGGTLYFLTEEDTLEYVIVRNDSLRMAYGGSVEHKPPFKVIHLFDPQTGEPNYKTQVVHAVLHKMPVNIDDVYEEDSFDFAGTKEFDKKYGYRTQSVLTIPMISHRGEAIGCLQLVNAKDPKTWETAAFTDEVCLIVQSLASQAAVILDNKNLIAAQKLLLESFIEMLAHAIDRKSPYTGKHCVYVPQLVEMIAKAACDAKSGKFADFNLSEEEMYELHIAGWLHDCGKVITPVHIMDKATKLETIHDRIDAVRARFEVLRREAKIRHLEGKTDKVGYDAELAKIDDDQKFIEMCNQGGEFLEDDKIARIKAFSQVMIEMNGKQAPFLSENEIYNLSIRRGTITMEERQIMNDHMVHTVTMLEAMPWPKHLKRVPEIACGHHEKMDGTGYPRGILAGTMSIPARMMAIADVFEALTANDRPYKKPKKLSEAMKIIGDFKRTNHLDPDVVDFFVSSKVYLHYAQQFLPTEQIDLVDEAAILAIVPEPMKTKKAG